MKNGRDYHEPDWTEVHREADSAAGALGWAVGLLLLAAGIILFAIL